MADVIDLFTRQSIPAQGIESDVVEEFLDKHYWPMIQALEDMAGAETEEEFLELMADARALVDDWPRESD